MPSEKAITKSIRDHLHAYGYETIKLAGGRFQVSGLPDVLAIKDGRAYFVEVKQPGERATKLQAATIERFRAAGCFAVVARSWDELKAMLDRHAAGQLGYWMIHSGAMQDAS